MQPMLKAYNSWKLFWTTRKRMKASALSMMNYRHKANYFQSFRLWKNLAK